MTFPGPIFQLLVVTVVVLFLNGENNASKKKKDVRDFTEADMERLYEEWEENDEDVIPDDEKPDYEKPRLDINIDKLRKEAHGPEDLLRLSKKGQSVMLFVSVTDGSNDKPPRSFTDRYAQLWTSNLHNNHIEVTAHIVEDDRILFLFRDGSRAWEGRDFLLKQPQCAEVTLEGSTSFGAGAKKLKSEL